MYIYMQKTIVLTKKVYIIYVYIYIYTHTGYVYVKTKQGVALPTGDVTSVTLAEERMQLMLDMIRDVDELLGTQGHMLLGLFFFIFF